MATQRITITDDVTAAAAYAAAVRAVPGQPQIIYTFWRSKCVPGVTVVIDGRKVHNVSFLTSKG